MSQALAVDSDPNSFALEEVIVGTNSIRIEFHHIAILGAAILAAVVLDPSRNAVSTDNFSLLILLRTTSAAFGVSVIIQALLSFVCKAC